MFKLNTNNIIIVQRYKKIESSFSEPLFCKHSEFFSMHTISLLKDNSLDKNSIQWTLIKILWLNIGFLFLFFLLLVLKFWNFKICFWIASTIVFLSLISKTPTEIISDIERIKKTFLWPSKPKIKKPLCPDFKHSGLKNVIIQKKVTSLQCSCVRKLYYDSFHE